MEARKEDQSSMQTGCSKPASERCAGCKRAAQMAPQSYESCGPTACRSMRPLAANANDAPYLSWLID